MSFSNYLLALAEGFGLIISPCILPVLPIVLSASVTGSRLRPLGIIVGFTLAFTVFTLFSRQLVLMLGIDPTLLRQLSFLFLFLVGIILLVPVLSERFAAATTDIANQGNQWTQSVKTSGDFLTGLLMGAGIGLVWVPCSGPILAAVIVQSIQQTATWSGVFIVICFALGAAIPMGLIALGGKSVMNRFNLFKTHGTRIRQVLGAVIIATVLYSAQDTWLPAFKLGMPKIAEALPAKQALKLQNGLAQPYPAPTIEGISQWLNGQPSLKGKVVLVDFWTYSCINCVRTLPYITQWYKQYANQGFVVVGVHAPEFEFEKKAANVQQAMAKHGITYPVALDNNFKTWRNFDNHYWPAHYLIDASGKVVYTHFGEGNYEVTENNIRYLLGLKNAAPKVSISSPQVSSSLFVSPETYLGYARAENFSSTPNITRDKPVLYTAPKQLALNHWALQGKWKITPQYAESESPNATLKYNFYSQKVYLVMGTVNDKPVEVEVYLDGKPIGPQAGQSVMNNQLTVKQNTLYELVRKKSSGSGVLELRAHTPGLQVYAFTFGN